MIPIDSGDWATVAGNLRVESANEGPVAVTPTGPFGADRCTSCSGMSEFREVRGPNRSYDSPQVPMPGRPTWSAGHLAESGAHPRREHAVDPSTSFGAGRDRRRSRRDRPGRGRTGRRTVTVVNAPG